MSKAVGLILLGGLLLVVLVSIGLLMWAWVRSENEPKPAPTKTGQVIWAEQATLGLVDARLAGAGDAGPTLGDRKLEVSNGLFVSFPVEVASGRAGLAVACA